MLLCLLIDLCVTPSPPLKMIQSILSNTSFLLSEAAVCERLRQIDGVELHPTLFDAPLIYDVASSQVLAGIYRQYIEIAREYKVPILMAAPTWRLDAGRIADADVPTSINRDAVDFMQGVRDDAGYQHVLVAGLLAPKNDCYDPSAALSADDAERFHVKQAQELGQTSLDCLLAQTMPSVSEAEGMARAMLSTGLPSVVSFCINRHGEVLDGTPLDDAIDQMDDRLGGGLLGYKVNCSQPSFVKAESMRRGALSRLIGINANASSKDHSELESMDGTAEDSLDEWADAMVRLNKEYGVKILGGCCGTDDRYLRAVADRMVSGDL